MKSPKPLSRRTFLRGAGSAAVGLPFLSAMLRPGRSVAAPGDIPRRVVFFFTSCGVVPDAWWPTGGETDFTLPSSLAPLAPHRAKLLIPDNIRMGTAIERRGDGGNGHDVGTGHCLTARPIVAGPSGVGDFGHLYDGSAGGISIDQHIANTLGASTPYRNLEFGVGAEGIAQALPSRISYRAPFQPVAPMNRPTVAFDRVFAPRTGDAEQIRRTSLRRRRVLDAVKGEIGRLRPRLDGEDRRRFDQHTAAIADIEDRLTSPSGACEIGSRPSDGSYDVIGALQIDLLVRALACDLTRVASIQWSTGQSGVRHSWLGHQDYHHSLSHRGISETDAKNQVAEIDRWQAEQFARLVAGLDAIEAGDGKTLLDYTAVVWVNEQMQSIGNVHDWRRMPFVVAGSCGGYFRTGRYVALPQTRNHGDLYVSVLRAMGMPDETFGDPDFSSGPISELT
jgi:Protein of unknown function (DUF1552)